MTTLIAIDPNVRVRADLTLAEFADVLGPPPVVGATVQVFERESGLHGLAKVVEIDSRKDLIYLAVDWRALFESTPEGANAVDYGYLQAWIEDVRFSFTDSRFNEPLYPFEPHTGVVPGTLTEHGKPAYAQAS